MAACVEEREFARRTEETIEQKKEENSTTKS